MGQIKRMLLEWMRDQGLQQADLDEMEDVDAEFKKWLRKREFRGKIISLTTYHTYLRYLIKFFSWLSWQPSPAARRSHPFRLRPT